MKPRRERSNFAVAFLFLSPDRREALDAVYDFFRHVDDAVDDAASPEAARAELAAWRARLDRAFAPHAPPPSAERHHDLVSALWRAAHRFPLRREDFDAVIEGCEWDLVRPRYATWEDLSAYCRHVASAVGLLCVAIFGAPAARDYAVELGIALQLTNILRDVDEDAARGRIYLPAEDLAAFGVTEADLLAGRRTTSVLGLLRFEADRARARYRAARTHLRGPDRFQDRARLLPAEIMSDIYFALLGELEARGFPSGRLRLPAHKKALITLRRLAHTAARRTVT